MSQPPVMIIHGHRDGNAIGGRADISDECVGRVRCAEKMARRHRVSHVIFCGVGAPGALSEAEQMAQIWQGPQVEKIIEDQSIDTAWNASCALPLVQKIGADEVMVVSSCWHIRLPLYYRPYRHFEIKCRFRGCVRRGNYLAFLIHEVKYMRIIPSARRAAFAGLVNDSFSAQLVQNLKRRITLL
jgi:hypothetical protein